MASQDIWENMFGTFSHPPESAVAEDRRHRRCERFYWIASLIISTVTVLAAGTAAVAAVCAFYVSKDALTASQQALDKAERQAEAAEKGLPRAWLYAEASKPLIVTVNYVTAPLPPGKRSFQVRFPFSIYNYGQTPGTIEDISAQLLVPNDPAFSRDPPADLLNPKFLATSQDETVSRMLSGDTIGPNAEDKPFLPLTFSFNLQPNILWHVEMLPKWLHLKISYRDPNGDKRETELLAGVDDGGFKIVHSPFTHWN